MIKPRDRVVVIGIIVLMVATGIWTFRRSVGVASAQSNNLTSPDVERFRDMANRLDDLHAAGKVDVYMDEDFDVSKPSLAGVEVRGGVQVGDRTYVNFAVDDKTAVRVDLTRIVAFRIKPK